MKKHPSGTSVIIALILIMVIMYVAADVASITTTALKETQAFNASDQAFYNAEGALEEGLYAYTHPSAGTGLNQTTYNEKSQMRGVQMAPVSQSVGGQLWDFHRRKIVLR